MLNGNLFWGTTNMKSVQGILSFVIGLAALTQTPLAEANGPSSSLEGSTLQLCPDRPNCVSSQANDQRQSVIPFSFTKEANEVVTTLVSIVSQMERTTIVSQTPTYLHVEFRSRIFRFVDDVEFKIDVETRTVQVRSASRIGYSDWGVNRKRVEDLRNRVLGKI